jgi:3,4-dihydroxy 2-butanone 4-phosphate synthase/GTP cyclohydrolase II
MVDDPIRRVELALEDLRAGRMLILVDDEDRENEGDLVLAAEKVTPEHINFMATHGRGLICLSLTSGQVERLGLAMMAAHNRSAYETAFTVSIEAREGVTTGISAADRAHTIQVAIDPRSTPRQVVTPGHVFPLRARDGGVLERVGQTEGSVDLARLAGLNPSGVICEIMNADGSMARLPDLLRFGAEHQVRVVAVADIIKYRLRTERMVRRLQRGSLSVPGLGAFDVTLFQGIGSEGRHLALSRGRLTSEPTLCRVQTAPAGWSFLAADASPAGRSARRALERIAAEGRGALVLMHLAPSPAALDRWFSQQFGGEAPAPVIASADTLRDLGTGCQILLDLGLKQLRLMTSSQRAIAGIEAYGLAIADRLDLG